jgi:hypothetical protein
MEALQRSGSFQARAGVLGNHHVIRLGLKLLETLCQVQNQIGAYHELRLLQFFQAAIYYFCITMNKKNPERMTSVRNSPFGSKLRVTRLQRVLRQV